jgi:hypothetical protein
MFHREQNTLETEPFQIPAPPSYKRNIITLLPSVRNKNINDDFKWLPSKVNASCAAFYSTYI